MKTRITSRSATACAARGEQGMAVIVVIALFAIMLMFLGSTLRNLNYLRQDLKLIERQQLQRVRQVYNATNAAIVTNGLAWPNPQTSNP